jgi:hypothetical protein
MIIDSDKLENKILSEDNESLKALIVNDSK